MRSIKFLGPFLVLLLSLTIITGCEKDEPVTTGSVRITYTNHPSDLSVSISPVENTQISITDWLKPDSNGILTYDLNIGNYILTNSGSTFFSNVGFQIKAGQTTVINFGPDNTGHVQ